MSDQGQPLHTTAEGEDPKSTEKHRARVLQMPLQYMFSKASPFYQTSVRLSHLKHNIFFMFLIGILVGRGILELALPKTLAQALQLASLSSLLFLFFRPIPMQFTAQQKIVALGSILFFADILLSCLFTSFIQDYFFWLLYLIFSATLLILFLCMIRTFEKPLLKVSIAPILLVWGWILIPVAALEMLQLISLPGESTIFITRPASLTGSFLHFPLIMAFFSLILLQWGQSIQSRLYSYSGSLFALSTILVASRSAIFIIFFATLLYPLLSRFKKSGKILLLITMAASFFIGFIAYQSHLQGRSIALDLVKRITTASEAKAAGNEGRIQSWKAVIHMWENSNWLIGEYAGMVTNSAYHINPRAQTVAESGVLQILVNFGLLGLVLFYTTLYQAYRFIHRHHYWLRALFLAALVQTSFYQSIEVLPFMALLLMLPWISQNFENSYCIHQK